MTTPQGNKGRLDRITRLAGEISKLAEIVLTSTKDSLKPDTSGAKDKKEKLQSDLASTRALIEELRRDIIVKEIALKKAGIVTDAVEAVITRQLLKYENDKNLMMRFADDDIKELAEAYRDMKTP